MTVSVVIQRVSDGETIVSNDHPWDEETRDFWWTEGNGACDCNRHSAFMSVCNPEYDEEADSSLPDDGFPCGHEAYRVIEFRLSDGTVIPCDDDRR